MKLKKFDPDKLAFFRKKSGLTYLELSRELKKFGTKISKNSIWGWEMGLHEPSAKGLNVLSAFFKVHIESFMK